MKKASKRETSLTISIVVLCLVFFSIGVSVPLIFDRTSKSKDQIQENKFNAVYNILTQEWYFADEVEDLDQRLLEQAIEGMTTLEEDPHTTYFQVESAQAFSASLQGSNVGMGISYYLNENNEFVIRNVFVDSPAQKAGLKKGDVLTKIAGMECSQNDSSKIIEKIQSNEGKSIEIEYKRGDSVESVKLTPTEYDQSVAYEINDGYATIYLTSFSEHTGKDFAKAMANIQKAGVKNLILDLRDNGGGYLSAVLEVAASLLPQESVVFIEEDKNAKQTEMKVSEDYGQIQMDKIVVLQNGSTASASECLIGALKDNLGPDTVTTVGTTTYGKGTEQTSTAFEDGTSIKYTIARWLTPSGEWIHEKGFEPDVAVELDGISKVEYSNSEAEQTIYKDTVSTNASAVQSFLKYLGYDVDRTDTYFSMKGSESLKQFQSDNGLDATGDCDKNTWNLLKEKALLKYNNETLYSDPQMDKAIQQIK